MRTMEIKKQKLYVFKMNDCDWWADHNLIDACENYCQEVGLDADECLDSPIKLTEGQMSTFIFKDEYGQIGSEMTFKDKLAEIENKPQFFASTEY